MKKVFFTLLSLATVTSVASAASISINFNSDRDANGVLGPGESAGAPGYVTTGWNNFDAIPSSASGITQTTADVDTPNVGALSNDSGAAVGTTISWTSVNAWNTNNGTGSGDNKLMNGYIDNNAGGPVVTVDIAGVPYANYSVVAYFGSDGNDRTGTIGISGGDTFSYNTHSAQAGNFPDSYLQTTDTGAGNPDANFAVWENQTASDFTLTLTRGSSNSGMHGLQIIQIPEPTSVALLGLGGLGLLLRRRR